jgi:hypothetical protein
MGFWDELVEIGTMFDWISPTLNIAQNVVHGPSHTFLVPQDCGWTGMEVANLLRRRGIKTWGHMIVNGTIMLTVRDTQSEFARYLLHQAGLTSGEPSLSRDEMARLELDEILDRLDLGDGTIEKSTTRHGLSDLLREIGNIRLR